MSKGSYKIEKLNSLIVAIVLLADTLSGTLSNGFGITTGANLYVLIVIFSLVVLKILLEISSGIKGKWNFTPKSLFLLVSILILYTITFFTCDGKQEYTLIQLIFYAVVPLLLIGLEFNIEYVLTYVVYMSLLTIPALNGFLQIRWEGYEQADLGKVYSLITMLICSIFHIRYYGKKANIILKLIYCYVIYVLVRVIMVANRGAILVLICTIVVLFIHKFDNDTIRASSSKKIFIVIFLTMIFYIAIEHMEGILNFAEQICTSLFGNVPSAISKMRLYIRESDISNGRDAINTVIFEAIKSSPIYGHGLNMFQSYTNGEYPYPHNYILQYLFEGGILFAFFPILFSLGAVVKIIIGTIHNKKEYITASVLVCLCIPKLLISTNVWYGTAIWMLIVYSANNLFLKGKTKSL